MYELCSLKPPFRADDMEGLYKKVIRGVYPKIPSHYSQDLNNIIKELLNVQASNRPDCGNKYTKFIILKDKILEIPYV